MAKKLIQLTVVFVLVAPVINAQVDVNRFTNIIDAVNGGTSAYGAGFKGRYNVEGEVVGDPYLEAEFRDTNYEFYRAKTHFRGPSRFDLLNDEFEVHTTDGIRVIKGSIVKGYATLVDGDSVFFMNARDYTLGGTPLSGFVKLLSDGERHLVQSTQLEIIKPNYNPAVEVGDKNTKIKKKATTYYAVNKQLFKTKSKKDILKTFESEQQKVSDFIESEKIDMKDENDLIRLFKFYNNLRATESKK